MPRSTFRSAPAADHVIFALSAFFLLLSLVGLAERAISLIFQINDYWVRSYLIGVRNETLTIFAILRLLEAAVAVVSGSSLNVLIGSISIGSVLEPIGTLLDYASVVFLLSSVSLQLQLLMHDVVPLVSGRILFSISMGAFTLVAAFNYLSDSKKVIFQTLRTIAIRVGSGAILLAVALLSFFPLVLMAENIISQSLMIDSTKNNQEDIEGFTQRLSNPKQFLNINSIKEQAENAYTSTLNTIVLFSIRTIVMPLLVVLILWLFFRTLIRR